MGITRSPSSYGRLSFTITATTATSITANITTADNFRWPAGGLKLRLRSPAYPAMKLSSVTIGRMAWQMFNATDETVTTDGASLAYVTVTPNGNEQPIRNVARASSPRHVTTGGRTARVTSGRSRVSEARWLRFEPSTAHEYIRC